MKKLIKLSALVALLALSLAVTGCNNDKAAEAKPAAQAEAAVTVGVSALKANPDNYLGTVKITGNASNVYAAEGVVEISDDKACCSVYLFVPFNDQQNQQLKAKSLYQGTMPARGSKIAATAVLSKVEDGYFLDVVSIEAGGSTMVSRI